MSDTISSVNFTSNLFDLLDEAFENHHGIFLDKGTSLFETLEAITPEEASIPVGGKCASLAAQVAHVNFYLEVLENYILERSTGKVDWDEIWRTVEEVSPREWVGLKRQLKETYTRVMTMLRGMEDWDCENVIGGAMAIVTHTAYHLGEIRQALCTLR